jgi:glyoxylase-like metal-dependent hydrolase (beta-lactamase superfamily II)
MSELNRVSLGVSGKTKLKKAKGQQKGKLLRTDQAYGSGRVVEYRLGRRRRLFQITTFCPQALGPGPTNLYLIEDDALILVDTGLSTNMAKELFYFWHNNQSMPAEIEALPDDYSEQELFSAIKLTGRDIKEIDYIFLTHGHIDHYFLGRKIVELSGTKVVAHVSDSDNISNPWTLVKFLFDRWPMFMAMGMPRSKVRERLKGSDIAEIDFSLHVGIPLVVDGSVNFQGIQPDSLFIRHFPGHSPGSIAIIVRSDENEEAFMLCGDTLLYPITPHPDDLVAYLRTLRKMRGLDNISLVLPAHGKAIINFQQRINTLERHHRYRLKLTYEACKTPRSIWQIATLPKYFDVYVDPNKFNPLAGQEAMVHAELLQLAGGLRRSHVDGAVHYFQNSGESFEEVYDRVQKIITDEHSTLLLRR